MEEVIEVIQPRPASDDVAGCRSESLVATFPPELLAIIFKTTAELSGSAWFSLEHLSQVCRHWREAALDAATLWSNVDFTVMPVVVAHRRLQRSKRATLHLSVALDRDAWDLDAFLVEMYRIETLCVKFNRHKDEPLQPTVSKAIDAPLLRKLILRANAIRHTHRSLSLLPPESPLPLLNTLISNYIPWPQVSPYFRPTLTELQLQESFTVRGSTPSLADFLHSLAEMPLLQKLVVSRVFVEASTLSAPELPVVQLPSLQVLHLYEYALIFTAFVNHVVFPASILFSPSTVSTLCALFIHLPGMHVSIDMLVTWLRAVFAKICGRGLIVGSFVAVSALKLTINTGIPSQISAWCTAPGAVEEDPQPASSCAAVGWVPHGFKIREIVETTCSLVPGSSLAGITTLVIVSTDENLHDESWTESFLTVFHELEHLRLRRTQGLFVCFCKFRGDGEEHPSTPFPKLKRLTLEEVVFRESRVNATNSAQDTFWAFIDTLGMRRNAGCPIQTLRVRGAAYLEDDDVRALRQIVENFEWTDEPYKVGQDVHEVVV